jgi:hypothetical protein
MLDVSGGAGVVVVAAEVKGVPKANATTPAKREAMVTVAVNKNIFQPHGDFGTSVSNFGPLMLISL